MIGSVIEDVIDHVIGPMRSACDRASSKYQECLESLRYVGLMRFAFEAFFSSGHCLQFFVMFGFRGCAMHLHVSELQFAISSTHMCDPAWQVFIVIAVRPRYAHAFVWLI